MNLFTESKTAQDNTRQIERIRRGIIQNTMVISSKTTSADKARINMINELLKH